MTRTDITAIFPDATKEQIDKLLDMNGGDINKAKGDLNALQGQLTAAQTELRALKDKPADKDSAARIQALEDELAGLKNANALRDLREKVAKDAGVPASLLTGDTEDACKSQAEAIKSFAASTKAPSYPGLPDGGEVRTPGTSTARDKFAEWAKDSL